jgi:hypothetical protein
MLFSYDDQTDDQFGDEEAAQRRDAVVKRMLSMPPQPRSAKRAAKPAEDWGEQIVLTLPLRRGVPRLRRHGEKSD